MKVTFIEVKQGKPYVSQKTGKTYYTYYCKVGNEQEINGRKGYSFYNVKLDNSAVENLIAEKSISNYKELEGRSGIICREYPIFQDKFEQEAGNIQKYDRVFLYR